MNPYAETNEQDPKVIPCDGSRVNQIFGPNPLIRRKHTNIEANRVLDAGGYPNHLIEKGITLSQGDDPNSQQSTGNRASIFENPNTFNKILELHWQEIVLNGKSKLTRVLPVR